MDSDQGGYRQINKSLNVCAFDDYLAVQTARLPELANVEQESTRVLRILGQNPGRFTFQGTNTFVLGTGKERLIIDTSGGEPEWAELVRSTLEAQGIRLSAVLLTHWHGDHTGGVPDLVRMDPQLKGAIYKNDPEPGQQNIFDGQVFRVQGATVRALHVPGHSEDHMCFILEEEKAMFTGDNVLGHGTTAVEDLATYMDSLQRMYDQKCTTGYSAHGLVIDDLPAKILRELGQKRRREQQVMQALRKMRGKGVQGASANVSALVTEIYGDAMPQETRALALEPFVEEVLRKLANDGRVAFELRGGVKSWYSVESVRFVPVRARSSTLKVPTLSAVMVTVTEVQ